MAKKNFKNTSGFEGMFGEERKERPAPVEEKAPVRQQSRITRSVSTPQYKEEIRYTFIADAEIIEKIKEIADYKRVKIKEVINYALGEYVKENWSRKLSQELQRSREL